MNHDSDTIDHANEIRNRLIEMDDTNPAINAYTQFIQEYLSMKGKGNGHRAGIALKQLRRMNIWHSGESAPALQNG